jgi:uncharacterized GH25 family protein
LHPTACPVVFRRGAFAVLPALFAAAPALAHETWLMPSAFTAVPGQRVVFDVTSGVAFPESEHAIAPERVARAEVRSAGEATALRDFSSSPRALQAGHAFAGSAVATVSLSLHPKDIELTDEDVAEYFAEIGAGAELRAAWEGLRGQQAWKETYTKHAKTFVTVGQAPADKSWSEPVGQALELVPLTDPRELRRGKDAAFKLLKGGLPLAGASVGLLREGSLQRVFGTTDAEGRIAFRLDRPGKLLVFAVVLRYAADRQVWESDFSSLTLQAADR